MMKRAVGSLVVAAALLCGGIALAQGEVQLPPAEQEIAAMVAAFDQVTEFFAMLIAEVKGAVSALNAVDADLAARIRAVAGRLAAAEDSIRELQAICAQVPGLISRVDGLADRLEEARAQIVELRARTESLNKADQELAASITTLAHNLERVRQDFASAIAMLADKVTDLTKQGAAHATRITGLEAADLALRAEIQALDGKLTGQVLALQSSITGIHGQLTDHAGRIAALDGKFTEQVLALQISVTGIHRQLADHAGRLGALEDLDISSLQRRILSVEQSVQALNIRIENNREKIAWLEKAIGGITADVKTTIGALQGRVDDHDARLAAVETTVTGLDVVALQDSIAMAQGLAIVALLAGLAALVITLLGVG